jgi:hypothetical protein
VSGETVTLIVPDAAITMEKLADTLFESASVTVTFTGNVPEVFGTPVIVPAVALRLKPEGRPVPEKE